MATGLDMLRVAQQEEKKHVKESPAGSNRQKYGKWYGMNGQPWCDMFVSWCAAQAGVGDLVGKYAYCPSHVNYFKKKGWWLSPAAKPQPGDIIFFGRRGVACHVGIVEKRNGTKSVTTIEGNTSVKSDDNGGAVMRRTRTYGNPNGSWGILGFARPPYGTSTAKTTAKATTKKTSSKYNSWIAALQKACNAQGYSKQTVDGEAGPKTLAACPTLRYGSKGAVTKLLQQKLGVKADGIFGKNTQAAVKAYQRSKGLTADGVVGKNTWRKLLGL